MIPWERTISDTQTKIGYRTIVHKSFFAPDGTVRTYDIVNPIGTEVGLVVAITPEKKVIVAEQFRPGPEKIMLELPGGFANPGETPEQTARRELKEETGYVSERFQYLGPVYKDGYSNGVWHVFAAFDCTLAGPSETDDGEFVDVHLISIAELIQNAQTGKMTDSGGVLLAYELLKEMEGKDGKSC